MASRRARGVTALAVLAALVGCVSHHAQRFRAADPDEARLLAQARPDVFPNDVRQDVEQHRTQLVLWAGIIQQSDIQPERHLLRVLVEHHYWDLVEHHDRQKEIAFLSPRGEGRFACGLIVPENTVADRVARVGDMAIVYGLPAGIAPDGTVVLRQAYLRTLGQQYYSTTVFDYGRDFLTKGDMSDRKILPDGGTIAGPRTPQSSEQTPRPPPH